ncbi:MAG: radical SAM family heme chaperone HemW [Phycisphaerae bacterium]|nr:radical SAM family heme chaperone HemW [Phycisphaerae bacterium]
MMQRTAISVLGQRAPHPLRKAGPAAAVRSLYIHVPFCAHKCHYCDFYSLVDTQDRQEAFVSRLCSELEALSEATGAPGLETIFIGGGTPSLLGVPLWRRLLSELERRFDLWAMRPGGGGEFTVECNPESVTRELLDVLVAGGVSRVSMGAQSFNRRHLATLERRHDPAEVSRAIDAARAVGIRRQSIDLISSIPGQTVSELREDLSAAVGLGTSHLSCYTLTYEPRTAMTARLERGEFARADEETEIEMFEVTLGAMRAAGLERYEVSNFARPGQECRHNLAYWRQEEWLAAGPSASGHVAGHRWKNVPRLDDYLAGAGLPEVVDHEPPDARRALAERIMTGLRLAEGLAWEWVRGRAAEVCGAASAARLDRVAGAAMEREQATIVGGRLRLTDAGFLLADTIAADLMRALRA